MSNAHRVLNCKLKRQVHDAICAHSLYHLLHNGVENKLAEQNKGKAPLGKAVKGLWSYLTCLQRDWLWCSENSSQTVTQSPENNCQTCSWTHWLACRQHRHELLFILFKISSSCFMNSHCSMSWVLLLDIYRSFWFNLFCLWTVRSFVCVWGQWLTETICWLKKTLPPSVVTSVPELCVSC